jgi:hypothetical protein
MSYLLRKSDVVAHFNDNFAAVGRAFEPITGKALTKVAVRQWPELVPELRARQLLEQYPELREFVLDPITRLSAAEMRERLGQEDAGQ